METEKEQAETLDIIPLDAIEAISRAEIDIQIATAKKYPRQLSAVKRDMMSFACLDQETAAACFYTLPRGGKTISGPSVRLAEIALSTYGNMRAGTRIIATVATGDSPHVIIQSAAHDLEKNTAVSIEKRRRITGKKLWKNGECVGNKPPDEDDINLATNAASSIAFRDALFKVIPLALVKPVYEQAKKVAIGDASTLVDRRAKAIETFGKMGIQPERILQRFEKKHVEDIGLAEIEAMIGLHNAIRDGDTTLDEAFPEVKAAQPVAVVQPAEAQAQAEMGLAPAKPAKMPPQEELRLVIEGAGYNINQFKKWAEEVDQIKDADSIGSWDEIGTVEAKRLLRIKPAVINGCQIAKEGGVQ